MMTPERLAEIRAWRESFRTNSDSEDRYFVEDAVDDLLAEIDALTRQLDTYMRASETLTENFSATELERRRLAADVAKLVSDKAELLGLLGNALADVAKLREYVRHTVGCDKEWMTEDEHPTCTCGMDRVLAETAPKGPAARSEKEEA